MNLVIEFPGDRVVPRERFSPRSQFFMGASAEQRTETLMAHWQMVQYLQHVNQYGDGHREQNQRLQRVDHLEQQH